MDIKKWTVIAVVSLIMAMGCNSSDNDEVVAEPEIPGSISFDSDMWTFDADEARVEDYLGRKSLYLSGGFATVEGLDFMNGIIEFDVAFDSEYYNTPGVRGFVGSVFRLQDEGNYEKFYTRPHRNKGEDDAVQMVPVYNHWSTWQLYWDGHFAGTQFVYDEWMHIKLVVSGKYCEVYIMDMENPAMTAELKREIQSGKVGLKVDPSTPAWAYFSNFTAIAMSDPPLKNPQEAKAAPAGTVMTWLVSDTFEATELEGKNCLTEMDRQDSEWSELESDPTTGVTALARLYSIKSDPPNKNPGDDTVFVRTTIISNRAQLKKLQFGYSDLLKLYFNGRLLYTENNSFGSRDYRFMGTMGYVNELYLPLQEGENELWMAVTGLFASWGVQARFQDMEGIEITTMGQLDLNASEDDLFCSQ